MPAWEDEKNKKGGEWRFDFDIPETPEQL